MPEEGEGKSRTAPCPQPALLHLPRRRRPRRRPPAPAPAFELYPLHANIDAAAGPLDLELVRVGLDALPELDHRLLELPERLVTRDEVPGGGLLVLREALRHVLDDLRIALLPRARLLRERFDDVAAQRVVCFGPDVP